jgi:hypothetical protein
VLAKAHGAPAHAVAPPALLQVKDTLTCDALRVAGSSTWRVASGAFTSGATPGKEPLMHALQPRDATT